MRTLFGLALAGALMIGSVSDAKAQFSLSLGNPYTGQGLFVGNNPYGYGYGGYPGSVGYSSAYYGGYPGYSSGYSSFSSVGVAPVAPVYGSGYYGAAPAYGVTSYGYPVGVVRYRRGLLPFGGARYRYRW